MLLYGVMKIYYKETLRNKKKNLINNHIFLDENMFNTYYYDKKCKLSENQEVLIQNKNQTCVFLC